MNQLIDRATYLSYAHKMTDLEKIYVKEYNDWLPDQIIDCHSHCGLNSHVNYIREKDFNHMISTFTSFSIEDSEYWNSIFHPDKNIRTLRFPIVLKGIDHKKANSYLLLNNPINDRVALFGLHDDINYTIELLDHPRVSALKMYPSYPDVTASKIYEYFPREVLKVAQEKSIPIILHLPTELSLCIEQVFALVSDFPLLKVCIAHIGLTEVVTDSFIGALTALVDYDTISFDTSLIKSSEVLAFTIKTIGYTRVMFGSDAPLHLVRSSTYHNPELGWRLATTHPYHWVDEEEHRKYGHLATNVPHDHWQSLKALKDGISAFPLFQQKTIKKHIFHDNAKSFYNFS